MRRQTSTSAPQTPEDNPTQNKGPCHQIPLSWYALSSLVLILCPLSISLLLVADEIASLSTHSFLCNANKLSLSSCLRLFLIFFFKTFLIVCMDVLTVCMSVYHVCTATMETRKEHPSDLELGIGGGEEQRTESRSSVKGTSIQAFLQLLIFNFIIFKLYLDVHVRCESMCPVMSLQY